MKAKPRGEARRRAEGGRTNEGNDEVELLLLRVRIKIGSGHCEDRVRSRGRVGGRDL